MLSSVGNGGGPPPAAAVDAVVEDFRAILSPRSAQASQFVDDAAKTQRLYNLFLNPRLMTEDGESVGDKGAAFTPQQYATYRRAQFHLHPAGFVHLTFVGVVAFRGSMISLMPGPTPAFGVAFALALVAVVAGVFSLVRKAFLSAFKTGGMEGWSPAVRRLVAEITRSKWDADDVYVFTMGVSLAMYALARALAGACSPVDIAEWGAQSCNPAAALNTVPQDMQTLAMAAPLVAQVFFRGASKRTVVAAWVAVIGLYNAAHVAAGAAPEAYAWVNVEFAVLIALSYEVERNMLSSFLEKTSHGASQHEKLEMCSQLAISKCAALEKEKEKERALVRHIAHEVRNPLNTMMGSLSVLVEELKSFRSLLPAEVHDIIATCQESCGLARDIVSDFVSFEKIAAGIYRLEISAVSVLNFAHDCVRPFITAARAKRIELDFQKLDCDDTTVVRIDPVKMGQVLRNLLSNAVKFAKTGGNVRVVVVCKDDVVTITVEDDGVGLSPEQLDELFQEGVQFNANANQGGGGSGLGLFIARGVVKLHDGCNLWATSAGTGCGTTFHLSIPRVRPRGLRGSHGEEYGRASSKIGGFFGSIKAAAASRRASRAIPQGSVHVRRTSLASFRPSRVVPASAIASSKAALIRKLRILVVDDSSATRKILIHQLVRNGHLCFEACDGLEAFAKVKRSLIARSITPTGFAALAVAAADAAEVAAADVVAATGAIADGNDSNGGDVDDDVQKASTSAGHEVYDAIVLDSNMPGMTGPEVTLAVRQIGYRGPIVGVSGDTNTRPFMDAGADRCLLKPTSVQAIMRAIEDNLPMVPKADASPNVVSASSQSPLEANDDAKSAHAVPASSAGESHKAREAARIGVSGPRAHSTSRITSGHRDTTARSALANALQLPSSRRMSAIGRPRNTSDKSGKSGNSGMSAPRGVVVDALREARNSVVARMSSIQMRHRSFILKGPSELQPVAVVAAAAGGGGSGAVSAMDMFRQNDEKLNAVVWRDTVSYWLTFVHPDVARLPVRDEDGTVHDAYAEHRRRTAAWPVRATLVALVAAWVVTRFTLCTLAAVNPVFTAAAVVGCAALFFMAMPFAVAAWSVKVDGDREYEYAMGSGWENCVVVLVTLGASLSLLARARQGACPPGTTMWGDQSCNPAAAAFEVPIDALFACFLAVPIAQVYASAASKHTIALCWLIVAAFVNASLATARSYLYIWLNLLLLAAACVSYEWERRAAVGFAMQRLLEAAKRRDAECAAEYLSVETSNARMARDELKVTVASTGHDMKSPVTALALAVESVIDTLMDGRSNKDELPPRQAQAVGVCVDAFCTVMQLNQIINRSTDYTKILGNLALRPMLSPTSFGECLQQVATVCSATSDVQVAIRAGSDALGEGLTDPSWLQDNLLCVIGNACKYSASTLARGHRRSGSASDGASSGANDGASGSAALAPVVAWGKVVAVAGVRMVEFAVQDSNSAALTADQLRALFDRPALFRRETVGGMGVGMVCLAERVKALGGDYGARSRSDMDTGTEVWFRIPLEPVPTGLRTPHPSQIPRGVRPMPLERLMTRCVSTASNGRRATAPSAALDEGSPVAGLVAAAAGGAEIKASLRLNGQAHTPLGSALFRPPSRDDMTRDKRPSALSPLAGLAVLVVDDAPSIVKMLVRMLVNAGAAVESAKDGWEAAEAVAEKKDRFDVVVTDIQMPRLDGFGLCRALRRMGATGKRGQRLLVIGMSANTGPECATKAKETGMDEFIPKPFRLQVLVDLVAAERRLEKSESTAIAIASAEKAGKGVSP